MVTNIHKFKKQDTHISFLLVLMLLIKSCDTKLPSLVDDNTGQNYLIQESIIDLKRLDKHTSTELWEQFFSQRGGKKIWQGLQQKWNQDLTFDFSNLIINSSEGIPFQVKEITKGIIKYLLCNNLRTNSITLKYGKKISLEEIYFEEILVELSQITKLESLGFPYNQLTRIPNELNRFSRLVTLDLASNKITTISSELSNFKNLRYLNMSCNKLKQLPPDIGSLSNLNNINFSFNQIEKLPPEFSKLNLVICKLHNNRLTKLPSKLGNLTSLQSLILFSNQLTRLPSQIGELTNLWYLNLSDNQLTELPLQIGNCSSLQELDLSKNQLQTIPHQIGKLTKLKKLILSYNQLTTLPGKLSNLVNLQILNVSFNQLTRLPYSILPRFLSLKSNLNIDHNPWLDTAYYRRKKNTRKLNKQELRLIVYQKGFPQRLLTLCTYYIKTHKELFNLEELKNKLPLELQHFKQLLRPAYKWNESKDIISYEMVKKSNYAPFYLDFPLITAQHIEEMLHQLKEDTIYDIPS